MFINLNWRPSYNIHFELHTEHFFLQKSSTITLLYSRVPITMKKYQSLMSDSWKKQVTDGQMDRQTDGLTDMNL